MDAAVATEQSSAAAATPQASRTRDALRLVLKVLALFLGTAGVLIAIVILVPDGNDYALATLKKHQRLATPVSAKKIAFVGGSNLAFGLDSALVERRTGSHVANMGMNGYFGVRFMLEEVKPFLKPSDVVVVSLEYDSFYKTVDGHPDNLLMIVKANPPAFSYLSWKQRAEVLKTVPYVAQQKVLRLVRTSGHSLKSKLGGAEGAPSAAAGAASGAEFFRLINAIETLAGFEEHGDLTSHFGLVWQFQREDGIDLTSTPLDAEVVGLLHAFGKEMKGRGVPVFVSYTPVIRYYYERHRTRIDELHRLLTASPDLIVPSPPSAFVFEPGLFFDTVYHLNREGRTLRTEKVIRDLELSRTRADAFSQDRRTQQ